jgi:hypothetical protein
MFSETCLGKALVFNERSITVYQRSGSRLEVSSPRRRHCRGGPSDTLNEGTPAADATP